jgi:hypothetical protein
VVPNAERRDERVGGGACLRRVRPGVSLVRLWQYNNLMGLMSLASWSARPGCTGVGGAAAFLPTAAQTRQ